jgi:hypothetical protein
METFGSGAKTTGMETTTSPLRMTNPGSFPLQALMKAGCCAVDLGISSPVIVARPPADKTDLISSPSESVSASVASPRINFFTLKPFISLHWLFLGSGCWLLRVAP